MGVVHFPLLQSTYTAIKGGGAFLNGAQIRTSSVTEPDDQQLMVICARTARQPALQTQLKPRSMGSATYHLCKLADGSVLAMVEATPKVWDIAAGLLVLTEAGGTALSPPDHPISRSSRCIQITMAGPCHCSPPATLPSCLTCNRRFSRPVDAFCFDLWSLCNVFSLFLFLHEIMQTNIYKRIGDNERLLGYTVNDSSPDGLALPSSQKYFPATLGCRRRDRPL